MVIKQLRGFLSRGYSVLSYSRMQSFGQMRRSSLLMTSRTRTNLKLLELISSGLVAQIMSSSSKEVRNSILSALQTVTKRVLDLQPLAAPWEL